MSENKEMQRPTQVARLVAAGWRDSARGAELVKAPLGSAALGDEALMGSDYECGLGLVPSWNGNFQQSPDSNQRLGEGLRRWVSICGLACKSLYPRTNCDQTRTHSIPKKF